MNEREVLEMLKSKIDAASKVGYNYAIETEDIDAINKALNTPAVSKCEDVEREPAVCHPVNGYKKVCSLINIECKECPLFY